MYTLLYLTCTRTYAPDLYVYMYTLLYTLLYNRYMYTMVSTSGAGALLGAGFATKPKGGGDEASTGFRYKRYTLSDSNPKPTPTPTPTPTPNPNLRGTSSPTTRRSSRSSSERRKPS